MEITNPQTFDHIKEAGGAILRFKKIDIGDWNMDTAVETTQAHGLNSTKIIAVFAKITRDDGVYHRMLGGMSLDPYLGYQGGVAWDATVIRLFRTERGRFDDTDYSTTPFNRGVITIIYHD